MSDPETTAESWSRVREKYGIPDLPHAMDQVPIRGMSWPTSCYPRLTYDRITWHWLDNSYRSEEWICCLFLCSLGDESDG